MSKNLFRRPLTPSAPTFYSSIKTPSKVFKNIDVYSNKKAEGFYEKQKKRPSTAFKPSSKIINKCENKNPPSKHISSSSTSIRHINIMDKRNKLKAENKREFYKPKTPNISGKKQKNFNDISNRSYTQKKNINSGNKTYTHSNLPSTPSNCTENSYLKSPLTVSDYNEMMAIRENKMNKTVKISPCKKNLFQSKSNLTTVSNDPLNRTSYSCFNLKENKKYKPMIKSKSKTVNTKFNEFYVGYTKYDIEKVSDIRSKLHNMYDMNQIGNNTQHIFYNQRNSNKSTKNDDLKRITFNPNNCGNNFRTQCHNNSQPNKENQGASISQEYYLKTKEKNNNNEVYRLINPINLDNEPKENEDLETKKRLSNTSIEINQNENNLMKNIIFSNKKEEEGNKTEIIIPSSKISNISNSYENEDSNINEFTLKRKEEFPINENKEINPKEAKKKLIKKKDSNQNLFNKKAKVTKSQMMERENDLKKFLIFTEGLSETVQPKENKNNSNNGKKIIKLKVTKTKPDKVAIKKNSIKRYEEEPIKMHTFAEEEKINFENSKQNEDTQDIGIINNTVQDMRLNSASKAFLEEKLKSLKDKYA
ncbi:MAG: hypothetical protein MJ252_21835 [archaeon]|nr:hypothetical protein [archaeon]